MSWNGSTWGRMNGVWASTEVDNGDGTKVNKMAWTKGVWQQNQWKPLALSGSPIGVAFDDITVVSKAKDQLDLFIRGADNWLYHKIWDGSKWLPKGNNDETWTKLWVYTISQPCAVATGDGNMEVYYKGYDNIVRKKSWDGTSWSRETIFGGLTSLSPPVVELSPMHDQPQMFLIGIQGNMYRRKEIQCNCKKGACRKAEEEQWQVLDMDGNHEKAVEGGSALLDPKEKESAVVKDSLQNNGKAIEAPLPKESETGNDCTKAVWIPRQDAATAKPQPVRSNPLGSTEGWAQRLMWNDGEKEVEGVAEEGKIHVENPQSQPPVDRKNVQDKKIIIAQYLANKEDHQKENPHRCW